MKLKKCFSLVLALVIAVSSCGATSFAAEGQDNAETVSAIERASGWFNTDISAGKYKTIGTGISMAAGDVINFNASYGPRSASVDFGLLDSNNVFTYINVTNGSIDAGVAAPANGTFTPAIRNNSSDSIHVSGIIECGVLAN